MMEEDDNVQVSEPPRAQIRTTTHRREWWGWFGTVNWLVIMMYAFSFFSLPSASNAEVVANDYNFYFILIFAAAIVTCSFCFGRSLDRLSTIALYTTPIAISITVVFPWLPLGLGLSLYLISPILMAPALVRRVFGVIHTVPKGKQLLSYISAFSLSYICYSTWLAIDFPKETAFLFPALLAIPAWYGIRRTIKPLDIPTKSRFKFSWKVVILFTGATLLLLWIATMNTIIFTNIFTTGLETDNTIITLLSYGLSGIGYLLYAIVSDKGHERAGLTISMMLFILGIFIGLLSGNAQGLWSVLLIMAITLGGSYFEFLFLSLPVYFLASTRRPLFVASLGVVMELIFSALVWKNGLWVPQLFWTLGPPLLFSAAFSAVVFVILISFLFERYREKSLAAVLHNLLYKFSDSPGSKVESMNDLVEETEVVERKSLAALELTPEEIEVALLLVDGKTRSEITRKLRLKSSDATHLINSIKDKISGGASNPVIATVVKRYKLTRRETDMLSYLQKGMTNQQIAEELFISESTAKNHVYRLMNKLPVKTRQEVPSWLETIDSDNE